MKKWLKILVIIILILFVSLTATAIYIFSPYLSSDPAAVINIEKGTVEINSGSGWIQAINNTNLKQDYKIRTLNNSEAEIIFFGASVARLDENSEVDLITLVEKEENRTITINQTTGNVWYTTSSLSKVKEFNLITPDGNFTDEGTSFGCSVELPILAATRITTSQPEERLLPVPKIIGTTISVSRGSIIKRDFLNPIRIETQKQKSFTTTGIIETTIPRNNWIIKNQIKDQEWIIKRREQLKNKYSSTIKLAKKIYKKYTEKVLDEEKINNYLDQILNGEIIINKNGAVTIKDRTINIPQSYIKLIPKELITKETPISLPIFLIPKDVIPTTVEGEGQEINCADKEIKLSTVTLSPSDRNKYDLITDNITIIKQPTKTSCGSTSGAIDLVHWNDTIAPGLVNQSIEKLIEELSKKMGVTNASGAKNDKIAISIAEYIAEHGFGRKFKIKYVYITKELSSKRDKDIKGVTVTFDPKDAEYGSLSYIAIEKEAKEGANIILSVVQEGTKRGHAVKVIALNTKANSDGTHNIAFVNPADGSVVQSKITEEGRITNDPALRVTALVAVSPK